MDPLTAFSLACGVIQVVDFSTKIIGKYRELRKLGASSEYKEMESMSSHLTDLATELKFPSTIQNPGSAPQLYHDDLELLNLAQQCSETATRLRDELQKFSIQGQGRKRDAFRKSVKIIWRSSAIENIQRSLERYRRILDTRILISLRQHVHLIANEESNGFRDLDRNVQNLILGISKNQNTFNELKNLLEAVDVSSKQHITQEFQRHREAAATEESYKRLLESLYFPDMHAREEGIDEAHKKTFEWIFEKRGGSVRPWHHFIDWLEKGHGTYWISGKAGSGKSTLMNFICRDSRTVAALRMWSGTDGIFISQFFFWNPGTQFQKSLAGLLRSLIYQIVDRYPDLMPVLAESTVPAQHRVQQLPTWTEHRLRAALQSLLSHGLGSDRLCIFIDGLDEFEGNQAILLDLIGDLGKFTWIKFCLSSRPYPIFRDGLGSSAMLKLQDLTESDIRKYVSDELNQALSKASQAQNTFLGLNDTVPMIVKKAEGVFLWVKLAVRDQIEGIWDKDDYYQLRIRLEALPDEIEGLYGHMLQKINRVHREEAAQYLQLVLHDGDRSLLTVALGSHKRIDDILQFSSEISISDIRHRCDLIGERVPTTCRGLLEVREKPDDCRWGDGLSDFIAHLDSENFSPEQCEDLVQLKFNEHCSDVKFLHRSAFEFFTSNEEGKTFLDTNASINLHPSVLIVKALTAQFILFSIDDRFPLLQIRRIMKAASHAEHETGVAQPGLMNVVDRSITTCWERSQDQLPDTHWCRAWDFWGRRLNTLISVPFPEDFLGFAAWCGLQKYVGHILRSQPIPWKASDVNYSLSCAVDGLHASSFSPTWKNFELIALLLERGADANTKCSNGTVWSFFLQTLSHRYDTKNNYQEAGWGETTLAFLRSGANVSEKICSDLYGHRAYSGYSTRLQRSARLIIQQCLIGCAVLSEIKDVLSNAGAALYIECTQVSVWVTNSRGRKRWLDLRLSNQQLDQFVSPYKERLNSVEEPVSVDEVDEIFGRQVVDLLQELDIETLYEEADGDRFIESIDTC